MSVLLKSKENTRNNSSQIIGHSFVNMVSINTSENTDLLCKKRKKGIRNPLFFLLGSQYQALL